MRVLWLYSWPSLLCVFGFVTHSGPMPYSCCVGFDSIPKLWSIAEGYYTPTILLLATAKTWKFVNITIGLGAPSVSYHLLLTLFFIFIFFYWIYSRIISMNPLTLYFFQFIHSFFCWEFCEMYTCFDHCKIIKYFLGICNCIGTFLWKERFIIFFSFKY